MSPLAYSSQRTARMRVAIPTFGDEVSPRFCFARDVLLVDIQNGRETQRTHLTLDDGSYPDRLRVLESRGVSLLVCGGFDRTFLPEAERAGVHIVWGVCGTIDLVLAQMIAAKPPFNGKRNPNCWCHRRRGR